MIPSEEEKFRITWNSVLVLLTVDHHEHLPDIASTIRLSLDRRQTPVTTTEAALQYFGSSVYV